MEHLKDNVARTKLFLWKKAQTPDKVVTPREQTQSYTVQDSTPVTITGHREAPTTPRAANTTARKTMTTDVLEMDNSNTLSPRMMKRLRGRKLIPQVSGAVLSRTQG